MTGAAPTLQKTWERSAPTCTKEHTGACTFRRDFGRYVPYQGLLQPAELHSGHTRACCD